MRTNPFALVIALAALSANPAPAESISSLYSTGLDDQSNPLPPQSSDPHYVIISAPDGTAATPFAPYVVNDSEYPFGSAWLADDAASQWIGPQQGYGTFSQDPAGSYDYRTTFDLTGLNPATAQITFQFIADNALGDAQINGTSAGLSLLQGSSLSSWSGPFEISNNVVAGTNTLDFIVYNSPPDGGNPSGLRLQIFGTASNAVLTAPPTITQQPISVITNQAGSATFTVLATGSPAVTYQWEFNGAPIPGATDSTLAAATNVGNYSVIVSNVAGATNSTNASLTFRDLKLYAGLTLTGPPGSNFGIQALSTLGATNWTTLTNTTMGLMPFFYLDYSSATNAIRFYRAVSEP